MNRASNATKWGDKAAIHVADGARHDGGVPSADPFSISQNLPKVDRSDVASDIKGPHPRRGWSGQLAIWFLTVLYPKSG